MVKEAEAYAEEDAKKKAAAEARNEADALLYSSAKTVQDLGDKVSAEDKSKIEAARGELQKALEGNDIDEIKAKTQALSQALHELSTKIYQAQAQAGQGQNAAGASGGGDGKQDDDVVD